MFSKYGLCVCVCTGVSKCCQYQPSLPADLWVICEGVLCVRGEGEPQARCSLLFLLHVYRVLTSQMLSSDCKRYEEVTAFVVNFCLIFFCCFPFREELWLESELGSLSFPLEHGGLDSRSRA